MFYYLRRILRASFGSVCSVKIFLIFKFVEIAQNMFTVLDLLGQSFSCHEIS